MSSDWPLATLATFYRLLRPLLFRLDAETAHRLVLTLAAGWSRLFTGRPPGAARHPDVAKRLMGLDFPNPIGLAAGLDKDGVAVPLWQRLGFGFIELGTVTAVPQPGNPRPRLFRVPRDAALINRMGFNNRGAAALAARLQALRARGVPRVPLGVNLGKSKSAPPEQAAADYRQSFACVAEWADYVTINVSSPNTPGLRALQTADELTRILVALQELNRRLPQPRPLLVKLAPDLSDAAAIECARAAVASGCAGAILTNTSVILEGLTAVPRGASGGVSGRPLLERATALLRHVRAALGPEPVLIGVGGILSPADAAAKFAAGADLVQIYTGLIYRGPGLPSDLLRACRAAADAR